MTFSKQLFLFLILIPLLHALNLNKCPSSYNDYLRCGLLEPTIRFPFCGGYAGFNLQCNSLKKTVIDLPMSGSFLVDDIDYQKQQITLTIPTDSCVVKRLLTFNTSGSPFTPGYDDEYTFLACPNEVVLPTWYPSLSCISNSTTSFFATTNLDLANSMVPSCQIVKKVALPASSRPYSYLRFSTFDGERLLLKWDSPDCIGCEMRSLRCDFKKKGSLEVKCFDEKSGPKRGVILIILGAIVGITMFASCIAIRIYNSERYVSQRRRNAVIAAIGSTRQPRPRWDDVVMTRGLDQSTIESYKKVELGESRRLPGTNNGMVCPICLSEYVTKDIVRCIPECDHCFHVDCIDVWLKIHGSCPICRNTRS
ncbi:unnamed protein product [Cochlearia groenlandica]